MRKSKMLVKDFSPYSFKLMNDSSADFKYAIADTICLW